MMTKIKSGRAAKLKLLCILPLAAFLVLALAEPRVTAETTDTIQQDQQKQEQQKMTEEKEKKILEIKKEYQIIQAKIAELEKAYKSADGNNGKKKEIKATLAELYNKEKKIEAWMNGENGDSVTKGEGVPMSADDIRKKMEIVKLKIEDTDDPETKKELEVLLKKLTVELKSVQEGKKEKK